MRNVSEAVMQEALAAWNFDKTAVKVERYGQGHINDTFCVKTQEGQDKYRYILQRMSTTAFRHPEQLMANIVGVTDYLRKKIQEEGGDPERETVTVKRTRSPSLWTAKAAHGGYTPLLRIPNAYRMPLRRSCSRRLPEPLAAFSIC